MHMTSTQSASLQQLHQLRVPVPLCARMEEKEKHLLLSCQAVQVLVTLALASTQAVRVRSLCFASLHQGLYLLHQFQEEEEEEEQEEE